MNFHINLKHFQEDLIIQLIPNDNFEWIIRLRCYGQSTFQFITSYCTENRWSCRGLVVSAFASHTRGRVFEPHKHDWLTSGRASGQKVLHAPNQVHLQRGHRQSQEMGKADVKSRKKIRAPV